MASMIQSRRIVNVLLASAALIAGIAAYVAVVKGGTAGSVGDDGPRAQGEPSLSVSTERAVTELDADGLSRAVVSIQTTRGRIRFRLYSGDAPRTVRRMVELVSRGFFNGLVFHRVEPGFVIQGGDPTGSGSGGSGQRIPAEFNSRKHVPGTVAMARAEDPDSADSQFYIALGSHPQLDGRYTVFGQVVEGLEVAQQIQVGDRMSAVTLESP
jgi:cyclophilin family peptidyl-prolyl cis-trans isomerase